MYKIYFQIETNNYYNQSGNPASPVGETPLTRSKIQLNYNYLIS